MIGIIVAEEKELEEVLNITLIKNKRDIFDKTFYIGSINKKEVVIVKSNVGKVNSARSAQMLIDNFDIRIVINIGTSGSVDNNLNIGDVVVADRLYQYDFDVTAFGRKLGEIENIGECIYTDKNILNKISKDLIVGGIASGDKFITCMEDKTFIRDKFNVMCIEMEGASIAQVCYLSNIPFLVIRSVTDKLDGTSEVDFVKFLEYSSRKVANILKDIIEDI
mgnify:FL=1